MGWMPLSWWPFSTVLVLVPDEGPVLHQFFLFPPKKLALALALVLETVAEAGLYDFLGQTRAPPTAGGGVIMTVAV